jgi:hypothetical protein
MVRRRRLAARYADRSVAGRLLAEALAAEAALERPVVLALPRGGVPVAAKVAAQLHAPLGLILVRKIGVPGRSELAMGALAMIHGQLSEFRNDEIVDGLGISSQAFDAARNRERVELERRAGLFPYRDLRVADSTVTIVDDAWQPARPCWRQSRLSGCSAGRRCRRVPVAHDRRCGLCGRSQIWSSASPLLNHSSRSAPRTRTSGSSVTRKSS